MSDPTDPSSPDELDETDELASAYLDGEVSAEEAARVESDPELQARVAALRAVADAIGVSPASPPGAVDDAVARALTVGDEVFGPASVVDLERERRRRERRRTTLWVVSAAAVVALIAIAIPVLGQLGSSSSDTAAGGGQDEATESADQPFAGEDASEGSAEAPAAAESTTTPDGTGFETLGEPIPLGAFPSEDDLLAAVRQQALGPRTESESAETDAAVHPCPAQVGDLTDVVAVYTATVDGEPFNAIVYLESPDEQAVVLVSADCDEVLRADI